jgi:hypothetical protein
MKLRTLAALALTIPLLPLAAAQAEETADTSAAAWNIALHGLVRTGFDSVADDERYDFIGRYDGFALRNARLIMDAAHPSGLTSRLSIEGATDIESGGTTPAGTLDARVRDGWLAYAPTKTLQFRAGQFRPGFLAESNRDPEAYPFATASLVATGVTLGAGFETAGLAPDRLALVGHVGPTGRVDWALSPRLTLGLQATAGIALLPGAEGLTAAVAPRGGLDVTYWIR